MSAPPERELTRSERAAIRRLVTSLCANYDCQDKLCLPLDCPCYMLNKWWTGAFCRYFRAAVLPTEPKLESALTGEDTSLRQTEIRAGTETAQAAKQRVMCPQLSPIRPVFSRVLRPCLRGAYIRILPASEMGLSCGQRAHFSALFL